jgi:hypothetical protein
MRLISNVQLIEVLFVVFCYYCYLHLREGNQLEDPGVDGRIILK